jgi:hypothetical protein
MISTPQALVGDAAYYEQQAGHTGMTGTVTGGAYVVVYISIRIIFKVENILILQKAKHNYIMWRREYF